MPDAAKPIRVMLVDDHRTVLTALEHLIDGERPGMEVVARATSRAAALTLVTDARPDVVLLDVDLGGEDGLEIIPQLIAGGGKRVLVLTGLRDPRIAEDAVVRGASGVVRKEEAAETLLKAIERVHLGELWLPRETVGRVLAHIRSDGAAQHRGADRLSALTARERQIVEEIASDPGADNRRLAERLNIGEHTLRNHLSRIYEKLGVSNRMGLYVYMAREGVAQRGRV